MPGGIGNHAYHLACQLANQGNDITILTEQRGGLEEENSFNSTLNFKVLRLARNGWSVSVYWRRWVQLFKLSKQTQPDWIILSGKFPIWTNLWISILLPGVKTLAVMHGSELRAGGSIGIWLTTRALNRVNKRVAVSHYTKSKALELNPKWEIEVINNGFESKGKLSASLASFDPNRVLKLITVGNLTLRKGQNNVIKALPALKKFYPKIEYHCVGIPTEEKSFRNLAQSLGVGNSVFFHGALPDKELEQMLRESHIFMMLSNHLSNGDFEGFGIAVLEANAMGLPAVGSKDSGIADAINSGHTGFLVNPHSMGEIVDAVNKLARDYNKFSQNALAWSEGFHWKQVFEKYRRVLNLN